MKRVILHDQMYTIGGPKAVLDGICNSYLKEKYHFIRLQQTDSCGFNPLKALRFIFKYRHYINKCNADIIYICGLQYIGLLMTIAARLSNVKKIVLSVHGSDWDCEHDTLRTLILKHIVERLEVNLADYVFTVCNAAQRRIKPLYKLKNNCGVIYNTFPNVSLKNITPYGLRDEFHIPADKLIVVTVGRVVKQKGHDTIIDVIKQLNDDRFIFVIVGDGPYLSVYHQICKNEILDGRVILLGKRTNVYEILKSCDIFLFPTRKENHSIALLEAINMHCAAIVTDVGGNTEIVQHKVSGYVVSTNNSTEIIHGLLHLSDSETRNKYTTAAFQYARNKFSISNTYGKLDKIFMQ